MNLGIENKTAIVTGAARGIGKAISYSFLKEGANVALLDSDAKELEKTVKAFNNKFNQDNQQIYPIVCDITIEKEVKKAFQQLFKKTKNISFLVNNAGISAPSPIEDTTLISWNQVLSVNLTGAFLTSKHAFLPMKKSKGGMIVNIGSFAGKRGTLFGNNASYSVSKAGIIALTKSLMLEGAPHKIRTAAVCPGIVSTDMIKAHNEETRKKLASMVPLGKLATPAEIADVVVFLCSKQASHITGEVMDVNGGLYID